MKKIKLVIFFSFLFLPLLQAEDITLTTYYPSPAGIYRRLELDGVAGQSDIFFHATGSMAAENNFRFFADSNNNATGDFVFSFGGETLSTSIEAVTIQADGRVDAKCIALSYSSESGTTECPPNYDYNAALSPSASSTGGYFFCCRNAY